MLEESPLSLSTHWWLTSDHGKYGTLGKIIRTVRVRGDDIHRETPMTMETLLLRCCCLSDVIGDNNNNMNNNNNYHYYQLSVHTPHSIDLL